MKSNNWNGNRNLHKFFLTVNMQKMYKEQTGILNLTWSGHLITDFVQIINIINSIMFSTYLDLPSLF